MKKLIKRIRRWYYLQVCYEVMCEDCKAPSLLHPIQIVFNHPLGRRRYVCRECITIKELEEVAERVAKKTRILDKLKKLGY